MIQITQLPLLFQETVRDIRKSVYQARDNKFHVLCGIEWLCRAQDKTIDGGVSAWYSLITGWQPSYIETTGYIINTFLTASTYLKRPVLKKRAIQMADFLVAMQHEETGGYRTAVPTVVAESPPTVFNTGQDLLGLTDIYELTGAQKYLDSVVRASDFLVRIQEKDGSWLQYTYGSMKSTYLTRVAWGLVKVWKITGKRKYLIAAKKNLDWAARQQRKNGWFRQNHLPKPNPSVPYTHTIAYAIEGFLWSGLLLEESAYIKVAIKAALPLANYYLEKQFLPATFDENWKSSDRYTCLTGDAQLALVWLELYKYTKNETFLRAAHQMLSFLKTTQATEAISHPDMRGAIKGSLPIYGDLLKNAGYCRFAFLNWATKFYLDALILEDQLNKARR